MHNAGNDYIYIEKPEFEKQTHPLSEWIVKICHRRYGIGSDGLVIMDKEKLVIQMFNSDGSESAMCGNAIFCIARYLFEQKIVYKKKFLITFANKNYPVEIFLNELGIIQKVAVQVEKPSLQMGDFLHPDKRKEKLHFLQDDFDFGDFQLTGSLVALQNPHFVVFVTDVKKIPIKKWGPVIEKHTFFPQGINIEFVQILSKNKVLQRTWERGSGETYACGSGSCAVCTAGYLNQKTTKNLTINLLGGVIEVVYGSKHLVMTSFPKQSFSGDIDLVKFLEKK